MTLLSPSPTPEPVDHNVVEPDCYGCGWSGKPCSTVCSACGCSWHWLESFGEPNVQSEACEGGCPCHTWAFAESRQTERVADQLEAAWKEAGYRDSFAVYQAEGR